MHLTAVITPMIDLNKMHHSIHQISGGMALRFNKATAADLVQWAKALRVLADEMKTKAEEATHDDRE